MASAQKAPLGIKLITQIAGSLSSGSLWDLRARALLFTAHSTMARRAELVSLRTEHLVSTPAGDGVAHIRRSKADQDGQGSERYLAEPAVAAIRAWLDAAAISDGPIFRRLLPGGGVKRLAISPHEVARIFKAAAVHFGETLPDAERRRLLPSVSRIAAHSTRIGAAQDLVASGVDLVAVMHAGGWRDPAMPALYTRRLSVFRGGMAQLYARSGEGEAPELPSRYGREDELVLDVGK